MKENTTLKKRVGVWIRVSTEDQAKGESPEHHEQRAREYAKFNEWQVVEVYDLAGVSGKTVMEHAEAKRMLADIRRGHITGLIFSKLARLARNTEELLKFAGIFREHNVDMISLQEKIDTSSPAGRLFYTMIAAMAQWEREEIGERVKASLQIRAKLGKSLGGAAPFGYQWKDNKLVVHPVESPIRKLMYELFSKNKRMKGVARLLNQSGYRTRNGSKFTDTTVLRLLQDTTAKGLYRSNHTYRDGSGKLLPKPEADWFYTPVEAIVSEELWKECNDAMDARKAQKPLGRKPVHLFAGLLHCGCGQKMYVFSRSPKYVCPKCRNKITIEDIEGFFHDVLHEFFVSQDKINEHLNSANQNLTDRKNRLEAHNRQLEKVRTEMRKTYQIYQADQITPEGFGTIYKPLEAQEKALTAELRKLQAEVDAIEMHQISAEEVLSEATILHKKWPGFSQEEKRRIIESIVEKVTLLDDTIDITWYNLPSSEELTKRQRNLSGSSPPPAYIVTGRSWFPPRAKSSPARPPAAAAWSPARSA
jgi:site-specific DNA recombinase